MGRRQIALVVAVALLALGLTPYSPRYYEPFSTSGAVRFATVDQSAAGELYYFMLRIANSSSFARLYMDATGAEFASIRATTTSDSDSTYTLIRYGSAATLDSFETVSYVETVRDSAVYWDKSVYNAPIRLLPGFFPARYIVLDVSNGKSWTFDVELRVYIKRE